jgi:hypothetical protein
MQYTFYYDDNEHVMTLPELFSIIKNNPNKEYKKKCDDKWITINNKLVCTTQFTCHRINTIDELQHINNCWGVEIDIRDKNDMLVLSHDPYKNGDVLEEYLREYKHALLILNIKSERVELDCLPLLEKYNIQNYFFLDSTFPMTYLLYKKHNIINNASRFSEFEPFEITENINHMIKWVWVDCFSILPLTKQIVEKCKSLQKLICIVSPELQGQKHNIELYKNQLEKEDIIPDAICCKEYNIINWI